MADTSVQGLMDRIPDVWFDWYARLIPGCVGLAIYLYLRHGNLEDIQGTNIILFLFFGYIIGHVLQPCSSLIIKNIEKSLRNEEAYARVKRDPNVRVSSLGKVSKAHAEANSMLSLSLVILLNTVVFWNSPRMVKWVAILLMVYFLGAMIQRIFARHRKIRDLGLDTGCGNSS